MLQNIAKSFFRRPFRVQTALFRRFSAVSTPTDPVTDPQLSLTVNQDSWSYELLKDDIKGIKYNPAVGNYIIMYTCGLCEHRQSRSFSKSAYHHGVVLVRCESCDKLHLVADNLKWFDEFSQNIETIMQQKNQSVLRVTADADLQQAIVDRMHKGDSGPVPPPSDPATPLTPSSN